MEDKKVLSDEELTQVMGGSGTGAGMASWAVDAYHKNWKYVWGGSRPGAVDASGLIYSYAGGAKTTEALISAAAVKGEISSMPDIPGLGLYAPGVVGVYVGQGKCVYASSEYGSVVYGSVYAFGWTMWFQIPGVSY